MGTQLQKHLENFILFCEAGFVAVNQMDEDSARKLFQASLLLKPENTLPKVGMGYMHLCKLELEQASSTFEGVLKVEPENEMAKTFLGISRALTPNKTALGEKILTEAATSTQDPDIKNLAGTALDFVEKFVKKAPSPLEATGLGKKKEKKKEKKK